jgi:transcriptional regulator with XRE-family HTH domain
MTPSTAQPRRTRRQATPPPSRLGAAIRRHRQKLRLSLRTFATQVGFAPSFLSQVETGAASPSIASLERIAHALGVTLSSLFQPPGDDRVSIVRVAARARLESAWSQATIEGLGRSGGGPLEPLLVTLEKQGASGATEAPTPGEVFVLVQKGVVTLSVDSTRHELRRGDAAIIPAGVPHRWFNASRRRVELLLVNTRHTTGRG